MLTIQFSENQRFLKKRYSIFEGVSLLASEEQIIQEAGRQESVTITIRGSVTLTDDFVGVVPLGDGDGQELFSYLEQELSKRYPENLSEVDRFVEELAQAYAVGRSPEPKRQPSGTAYEAARHEPQRAPKKSRLKTTVVLGSISVATLFLGVLFFFTPIQALVAGKENQTAEKQADSLTKEDLDAVLRKRLEKEDAVELGKEFPKQQAKLVELLTEAEQWESLRTFHTTFPTDEGRFALAFHDKKWKEVTESPLSSFTEKQQVLLAHAYIQLGQLSEAEILNAKLKSETIRTEIAVATKKQGIRLVQAGKLAEAQAVQKKLNDAELEDLIATGKTCQEMIEFYKKEKDVSNQSLWQKRLERLGEEFLTND